MFDFLRLQYLMGRIDETQLRAFVPTWITDAQADAIVADPAGAQP